MMYSSRAQNGKWVRLKRYDDQRSVVVVSEHSTLSQELLVASMYPVKVADAQHGFRDSQTRRVKSMRSFHIHLKPRDQNPETGG